MRLQISRVVHHSVCGCFNCGNHWIKHKIKSIVSNCSFYVSFEECGLQSRERLNTATVKVDYCFHFVLKFKNRNGTNFVLFKNQLKLRIPFFNCFMNAITPFLNIGSSCLLTNRTAVCVTLFACPIRSLAALATSGDCEYIDCLQSATLSCISFSKKNVEYFNTKTYVTVGKE